MMHEHLCRLLDKHEPKKQKTIKKNDFRCMSKELMKAMLYRNRLRNKYYKFRSNHYLSLYKAQRNHVNAIKRREICKYFEDKCKLGTRNKDFWNAIKPMFSKSRTKSDSISIRENGEIVTDEQKVCSIFNTFFQSIGSDIGHPENNEKPLCDIISQNSNKEQIKGNSRVTINDMKYPSLKMATGYDLIKELGSALVKPLTLLINKCILSSRKGHSCQDLLIRMTEDIRQSLDLRSNCN